MARLNTGKLFDIVSGDFMPLVDSCTSVFSAKAKPLALQISIGQYQLEALIDSGATHNFIDYKILVSIENDDLLQFRVKDEPLRLWLANGEVVVS